MGGGTVFRNISVVLTGTSFGLASTLHRAVTDVDNFGKHVKDNSAEMSKWKLAASAMAIGGATIAAGLGLVVKTAADFQTQMANVNSISYLSSSQLSALGNQVIALSKQLPQSATTLASGLYDIASSGFQGADGLTVLKASAQAASAGLSTTATAAQAIDAVLNAYGLSAGDAQQVSDALFQTVNLGVVSFDQLAGSIGDVVGLASQAHISINDVGAALATMTLSGISADEASTSLNRLIQNLVQPSKQLAVVYQQLGYQSGLTALQTEGLHGVMLDLQKATGGNANAMLDLFPDIRAVRGALALLTQQGDLYTKQQQGLQAASDGVGATQRALAEQSKAASFQFHLFVNDITAGAISLGQKALPVLVDLMHGAEHLGSTGFHALQVAAAHLAPVWADILSTGQNIEHVIAGMVQAGMPLVHVFVLLGGGAAVAALKATGAALSGLTGFLNDNKAIVETLAVLYAGKFAKGLLESGYLLALYAKDWAVATAATIAGNVKVAVAATRFYGLGAGLRVAAGGFASMIGPLGLVTLALGAGFVAFNQISDASRKAKEYAQSFVDGIKPDDIDASAQALDKMRAQLDKLSAGGQGFTLGNVGEGIAGAAQVLTPFTRNTVVESNKNRLALSKQIEDTQRQINTVKRNAQAAAAQLGLLLNNADYAPGSSGANLITAFAKLADESDIDLSKPGQGVDELAAKWKSLHDTVGGGIDQMVTAGQVDVDQLQAIAKAVDDAGKAADKAFGNAEDIIGGFSLKATAKDVTDAQKEVEKAQKAADAAAKASEQTEARLAGKRKLSIAQQQQLTNAQDKATTAASNLTQAQQALADARDKAAHPDQQYKQFLADQLQQAKDFVSGVQQATARGLNQNTVASLLEAGPKDAAPVLAAIAADHSGDLVRLVNQTQQTLDTLNQQTVEDARLTQRAIASTTDQMSKDLSTALSISNLEIGSGGAMTADDIAQKLGISTDVAKRIGDEFGITFAQATQQVISANAAEFSARFQQPTSSTYRSQVPFYRASGGLLDGPGTTTSDSIPVMASKGEYVARARAVAYYGVDFFDALNSMRLPRFAGGGLVGGGGPGYPATVQHITNINFEPGSVVTPDPDGLMREIDRKKRLAGISGRANG